MRSFAELLNDMFISVFHKILRVEEEFLQKRNRIDLSIREMHMIEYIGGAGERGRTLSEIAGYLKIAKPSVTVAVRKLAEKGYLTRSGSAEDGRVVNVTLTRDGEKIFRYHMQFHLAMIRDVEQEFDESEKKLLIRVMSKLDEFFESRIGME